MARTLDKAEDFPVGIEKNEPVMAVLQSAETTVDELYKQLDILGLIKDRIGKKLKKKHIEELEGLKVCFLEHIRPKKRLRAGRYEDLVSAIYHFINIKEREQNDSEKVKCLDVAKEMLSDISLMRSFFDVCFRDEKKQSGSKKWIEVLSEGYKGGAIPSGRKIKNIFNGMENLLGYKSTTLYSALKGEGRYFELVSSKIREHFNCVVNGDCEGVKRSDDITKIVNKMESDISLVRAYLDAYFRMTDNQGIWHRILEIIENKRDLDNEDSIMEEFEDISVLLGYKDGLPNEIYNALRDKKKARIEVARRIRIQLSQAIGLRDRTGECQGNNDK